MKMGKNKSIKEMMYEYDQKYGHIPLDDEERLAYLRDKYKKINLDEIARLSKEIDEIPWETEAHLIEVIPKPGQRPRYSFETEHFYVPGSATNKGIMKKILGISENLIHARVAVILNTYQPTPCYKMNQNEIYLAELGKIRPLIDPDFDNFAKSYMDAIQGVLVTDDNIITDAQINKFFSVKPRVYIELAYQTRPDSKYNEKILIERLQRMNERKRK